MPDRYNGYSNYPTWNVALWLDFSEDWITDIAKEHRDSPTAAGEALRDYLEELRDGSGLQLGDYGMETDIFQWAWSMVNWYEIGEHMLEDLEPEDDEPEDDDDEDEDGDDDE